MRIIFLSPGDYNKNEFRLTITNSFDLTKNTEDLQFALLNKLEFLFKQAGARATDMSKRDDCECQRAGSFPLFGEGFSRRRFLRGAGTGLVASYFAPVLSARLLQDARSVTPSLRNSAKNCILIFLAGAPSNIDSWDLKEGPWTPADFNPTPYGAVLFPQGLMPHTAAQLDKVCVVRTGLAWSAVHSFAQTWAQIGRNPVGPVGSIAPHIGAVVALESQLEQQPGDVLPAFVSIDPLMAGSGYLPARYAPFPVIASQGGLAALTHTAEEFARYGNTIFGGSLAVARNLIRAGRGTRFVQVTLTGWDNHSRIYDVNAGIYVPMKKFDPAFGALLTDLAAAPGSVTGKTLLDETLVVVIGEFGRTVGALNAQAGRDHFPRMSIVFAGGGVKGGRVIGATDPTGAHATEFGLLGRDARPEDVTSTIYSALGIDYTTVRHDDPLGRGYEYVPFAREGTYGPIEEVFG